MGISISCLVIFYSLCCCFYSQLSSSMNVNCHPSDLKALRDFVNGLQSPIQGWQNHSSDCCTWKGVTCDSPSLNGSSVFSRVVGLELAGEKLRGKVSESLADLVQLRTLDLSRNFLTDSLPLNLFFLKSIQAVDLSSNDLSGDFDPAFCKTVNQIRLLDLSSNRFQGKIPPGFGYCTSLEHLSLGSNSLTGNLPPDLFTLQKLKTLDLRDNGFTGELSFHLGNLSNLVFLDVSSNRFSGWLPDVFFNLGMLEQFTASSNNFTGPLPVSLCNSPTISSLSLNKNSLSGSINGINCSAMVRLTSLNLGSNHFAGSIESLSSCQNLRILNLAMNRFEGDFPESFKNLKSLIHLSVTRKGLRNLAAALSSLEHCRNLTVLILTFNFQREVMPADSNFRFEKMRLLAIANCGITGSVPKWLSSSMKLQILDLSWNNLVGSIPDSIGQLGYLLYVDFANNSLSGSIPRSLTRIRCLTTLELCLEGDIFEGFSFFSRKPKSSGRKYKQIWGFPPLLDLSYNRFGGGIWPEFGNLKNLHVLDLSNNQLSGNIPSTLSNLTNLESLDLSYNNLTGEISDSLANLYFLSNFNVSHNHLQGRIPSRGQFHTFANSSFAGNDELCGDQTFPCEDESKSKEDEASEEDGEESLGSQMRLPLGIGVAFGFVSTVTVGFLSGMVFPEGKKRKFR